MAEFVEFRAEEWISELERMERIHLFEQNEIKSIAKKRRELEYKIQRKTKYKEDFLKYIQFENDLHRIIKARREKSGIKADKAEIDHSLTRRIAKLFKQAIFKFPDDVKLWMSFFKFCEGVKFNSLVSRMLVRMLQIHSNKPELWIFASKWELEKCKSVSSARQFLTRGLRHHPSSLTLYQELFALELYHRELTQKEIRKKKTEDENFILSETESNILEGKVAEVIYDFAIKTIPGVEFKVDLLNIAKAKKAPENLKNKIFKSIVENHENEELTWDTIAKKEFEAHSFEMMPSEAETTNNETIKMPLRDRIQKCINVYEEAVRKLNTPKMWDFYLDYVSSLNDVAKNLPVFRAKLYRNAMEGALVSGNLSEKHYLGYVQSLNTEKSKKNNLEEVLKKGTEDHPKSVPLWHARLKFYLIRDREVEGHQVFCEAVENVADCVPLWKMMIKYMKLKSSSKLEELLKGGITRGGEVAQILKPSYLEWLAREKGISEARRAFESPEMNLPPSLELYKKMANLESSEPEKNIEKIRKCHELACSNFGENNPNVWLDYVRFELKEGDKSRVTQIHRRAVKNLLPEQADEFITKFNNFKIGDFVNST